MPEFANAEGTGRPPFITLHIIGLWRYCVLYEWKVSDNPKLCKSIEPSFQHYSLTSCLSDFTHFHILEILTIFQLLSVYLLRWFVISDLCWWVLQLFWGAKKHPYAWQKPEWINVVCSISLTGHLFLHLFLSPQASLVPWGTTIMKLGQLKNLHWYLSAQVKGRGACLSLSSKARNDQAQWGRHVGRCVESQARPLMPNS